MTDVRIQPLQGRAAAALPPGPVSLPGRWRQAVTERWLNHLFWCARQAQWFVRCGCPFYVWLTWTFSRRIREGTVANARWLLGETSTRRQRQVLGRQVLASFSDFVCDMGRCHLMPLPQLFDQIEAVQGQEPYLAARAAGKGAIVITAHMGSFEIGMAALTQQEKRIHVVFQRDAMRNFERLRARFHQRMGIVEVPIGESWTFWMQLRDALAANEVVVLQADRVMPGQRGGQPVPFLGGHMMLPGGPVKLALLSGAPIIPIFAVRTAQGKARICIEPPIYPTDVPSGLGQVAAVIEKYVRAYPQQWLVLHKAWCEDQTTAGAT